jgi:hypothetical protein
VTFGTPYSKIAIQTPWEKGSLFVMGSDDANLFQDTLAAFETL